MPHANVNMMSLKGSNLPQHNFDLLQSIILNSDNKPADTGRAAQFSGRHGYSWSTGVLKNYQVGYSKVSTGVFKDHQPILME